MPVSGPVKSPRTCSPPTTRTRRRPRDWARGGASEAAPGSGRSRPRAARGWASGASPRVTRSPRRWRTTRRRRGRRAEGWAPPGWASALPGWASAAGASASRPRAAATAGKTDRPRARSTPWTSTNTTATTRISCPARSDRGAHRPPARLFPRPSSNSTDTAGPIRPGQPSRGPCGHQLYPATAHATPARVPARRLAKCNARHRVIG